MDPFQSLSEYEQFVYTLQQQYTGILRSTLTVATQSRSGHAYRELHFEQGYRLLVSELLTWDRGPVLIQSYGYEAWNASEKLYWYDPQPHPDDPSLASTHPHHKHTPPDIKHHRIPAPGLRFDGPNLPLLIEEILGQLVIDDEST